MRHYLQKRPETADVVGETFILNYLSNVEYVRVAF